MLLLWTACASAAAPGGMELLFASPGNDKCQQVMNAIINDMALSMHPKEKMLSTLKGTAAVLHCDGIHNVEKYEEILAKAFAMSDTDGDGVLSHDEQIARSRGLSPTAHAKSLACYESRTKEACGKSLREVMESHEVGSAYIEVYESWTFRWVTPSPSDVRRKLRGGHMSIIDQCNVNSQLCSQDAQCANAQNCLGGSLSNSDAPSPDAGGCHPSDTTVQLKHGVTRRMDELTVGDEILSPGGFTPVLGFMHQERDTANMYFEFTAGKRALAVSAHHHVVANGKTVDPATIKAGDVLHSADGSNATVTSVQMKAATGAFHFMVAGGEYYVDGLLSTDYDDHIPPKLWELLRMYVKMRYRLGVPMIPEGHGLIKRPFFAFDTLDAIGVRGEAQWLLLPLLVPTLLATELVNLAAESALASAMLAALGLGYICSRKAGEKPKSV